MLPELNALLKDKERRWDQFSVKKLELLLKSIKQNKINRHESDSDMKPVDELIAKQKELAREAAKKPTTVSSLEENFDEL